MTIINLYLQGLWLFLLLVITLAYARVKVVVYWAEAAKGETDTETLFTTCGILIIYPAVIFITILDAVNGVRKK